MGWAHRRPRMACVGSSALSSIDSPRPPPPTCNTAAPPCLEGPLRLPVGPAVSTPPPRRCLGAGRAAGSEPAPAPAVPSARRRHARYDYPRGLAAAGWRAGLLCPFCRSCGSGLPALVAEAEADTAARARAHQQKGAPECVARRITVALRAGGIGNQCHGSLPGAEFSTRCSSVTPSPARVNARLSCRVGVGVSVGARGAEQSLHGRARLTSAQRWPSRTCLRARLLRSARILRAALWGVAAMGGLATRRARLRVAAGGR